MQKRGGKTALGSRKGTQTIPEVTLQLSVTGHLGSARAPTASPSFPTRMAPRTRESPGPPAHSTATAQLSRAGRE